MIKLKNLSYSIFNKPILKQISLEIKPLDKLILVGENGSGKTTLLRILTNSIPNKPIINTFKTSFYLPDKFHLPNHKSRDFLIYLARLYNSTKDIDYLMDYFSLPNKKIKALSKGNYQKLGIILGIISNSEIIYYDEAFDGLDKETQKLFIAYLEQLNAAVVIVTHYPEMFLNSSFKRLYIRNLRLCEEEI